MAIASLCEGDTVLRQVATHSLGAMGGDGRSYVDGSALSCTIQTPSASEVRDYAARGQRLGYWAFFSTDPGLSSDDRLKWTIRSGEVLASPKVLRILDKYTEGRPGGDLLWVCDCEEVSTRPTQ